MRDFHTMSADEHRQKAIRLGSELENLRRFLRHGRYRPDPLAMLLGQRERNPEVKLVMDIAAHKAAAKISEIFA